MANKKFHGNGTQLTRTVTSPWWVHVRRHNHLANIGLVPEQVEEVGIAQPVLGDDVGVSDETIALQQARWQ